MAIEAAQRLEAKLKQRAEEVRENEATLLGHLEKWSEKFHQWGEDLNGWDKRWSGLETRLTEWETRLGELEKAIGGFVEKAREVIRRRADRGFER